MNITVSSGKMTDTLFQSAIYLLIGYFCGMWLSQYIYADFAQTVWTNIWTYFWLLLWPLGLAYWFFITVGWLLLMIMMIVVIAIVIGIFFR